MPFLMARAPVRRGSVRSLRSKAAVWLLPSTGSEGEALKRLGLGAGLSMLRIVRVCVDGSEGQRKRGGRAKSRRLGWRGGIAMCWMYMYRPGGGGIPSLGFGVAEVRRKERL